MAQAITKVLLSGSAGYGRGIKVTGIATAAAVTIHDTGNSATILDEVWLRAFNSAAVPVLLTLEITGIIDPDNIIEVMIPPQKGLLWVLDGHPLTGTGAAPMGIEAFADTANVIVIYGHVNRIT